MPIPPERSPGVVHCGGVEGEQFVVAAAVERKLLDLALVDEAGGLLRGGVHAGIGGVDFDGLLDGGNTEDEVELKALADGEGDAGLLLRREPVVLYLNGVGADWDGGRKETAFGVGGEGARRAGFNLADGGGGI